MAEKVKLAEIPSMTVQKVVNKLSKAYVSLIKNNTPLSKYPSVMLWGQPGVGKSAAIHQIKEVIEKETGKHVDVRDVRLLLFNPIDLRGIPFPDEEAGEKVARWLKPTLFKLNPSDDYINIIFLDEISSAPQSVQAAAYQITLDHKVGEHKLPENTIVIAAGNRVTDRSVAYKMPKALSNRLLHFEVDADIDSWKKWAIANDIHPTVMGFLAFKPTLLNNFDSNNDSLAYATPRSWEMVSNLLNYVDDDVDNMYDQISGLIGSGAAIELRSWWKLYSDLPTPKDIFAGKATKLPSNPSAVFALTCSLISYMKKHKDDLKGIINSIKYASKFPRDFSVIMMEAYLSADEELQSRLMSVPEFVRWMGDNVSVMNGQFYGKPQA